VARQFFVSARLLLQLKDYAKLMVVMTPREKWTDERLDDLNKKVDDVRTEMREGFARIDADIRALRRDMYAGFFVIIAAIIGSNATMYGLLA
jgi:t-SNARE complex subunit (syntaxin)